MLQCLFGAEGMKARYPTPNPSSYSVVNKVAPSSAIGKRLPLFIFKNKALGNGSRGGIYGDGVVSEVLG
jgi:hypothetical protein